MSMLSNEYDSLSSERETFLARAIRCSDLTIPGLIVREEERTHDRQLKLPYQSVGASCVNSLSSKLTLGLFPPNQSFFRLGLSEYKIQQLINQLENPEDIQAVRDLKSRLEKELEESERQVIRFMESRQIRPKLDEGFKQLIVAGNYCLDMTEVEAPRLYPLSNFVISRDYSGNVIKAIIKETVSPKTLEDDILDEIMKDNLEFSREELNEDQWDVYTGIYLQDNKTYKVWQEIKNIKISDSEVTYKKDKLPYIFARFRAVDGESYGRSYVEEYLGSLLSLDGLDQAILQGSLAAARNVYLVEPGTYTASNIEQLVRAPNQGFVLGSTNEVNPMNVASPANFQVALAKAEELTFRLEKAFLVNSSVQRNAERVTAEEIRLLANELENQLGGLYSVLSKDVQLPLVNVVISQMEENGELRRIEKGLINVTVTTGIEALGRGQDVEKLQLFLQDLRGIPPEQLAIIDWAGLVNRLAMSRGIDTNNLIKSKEQMAAEQAQAQQQQQEMMMQQAMMDVGTSAAPEIIKQELAGE